MFITSMTVEVIGERPDLTKVPNPTWQNVESAIQSMNGDQRSIVTLDAPDGSFMAVGGGENGIYVCFVVDSSGSELRLLGSPAASTGTVGVYMGQQNIRSRREVADLATVLAVANLFAMEGELSANHQWSNS